MTDATYIIHCYDRDDRHTATYDGEFKSYWLADRTAKMITEMTGFRTKPVQGTLAGEPAQMNFILPEELI